MLQNDTLCKHLMCMYMGLPILGNGNSFKNDRKYERGREGGDEIETHREKYTGHSQHFCGFYSIYERRQKHTKYMYN